MFGYFFWNAAISWSSKVFRPAPSHSFNSTFSLLTSVLTGSEFALDFDDDDPGPHAATDARQATGHDGSDVAVSIKLTTMAQPSREIGRIAARKTLDLAAKKTLDEPRTIIQTVLTPGDTTRPIAHE